MMATEYDVTDTAFASKPQMLNAAYASEAKMNDDMVHGIECDPDELSRELFYTKKGVGYRDNLTAADRDFYVGNFTIATQGGSLAPGMIVGSIYVNYEFAFLKEEVRPLIGLKQVHKCPEITVTSIGLPDQWPLTALIGERDESSDFLGITFSPPDVSLGGLCNFFFPKCVENTFILCTFWYGTENSIFLGNALDPIGILFRGPFFTAGGKVVETNLLGYPADVNGVNLRTLKACSSAGVPINTCLMSSIQFLLKMPGTIASGGTQLNISAGTLGYPGMLDPATTLVLSESGTFQSYATFELTTDMGW